jgi:predicted O-methyltransferase YrrM
LKLYQNYHVLQPRLGDRIDRLGYRHQQTLSDGDSVMNDESGDHIEPAFQDLDLKWVGDLSIQDAQLLRHYTLNSKGNIIEFGAGGSTHIIAQSMGEYCKLISIDTSLEWIEKTQRILKKLGCSNYFFVTWEQWINRSGLDDLDIELIFNDGCVDLREVFGLNTWPLLKPGGYMIYHDCRHESIIRNITKLIETYYNEIEDVKFNARWQGVSSNMTVILKKVHEPYINWNSSEGKPLWRYGHPESGPIPDSYWDE